MARFCKRGDEVGRVTVRVCEKISYDTIPSKLGGQRYYDFRQMPKDCRAAAVLREAFIRGSTIVVG